MRRLPSLLRWLALAALADWLVTRTLARAAIFMPKSPPVLAAYEVVVTTGQVASVLAALLALVGMLWLSWQIYVEFKGTLSLALIALVCLSLALQVVMPGAFVQLIYHALILAVVLWVLIYALWREAGLAQKFAVMVAGVALLSGGLFQSIQVLSLVLEWSEPPAWILVIFNLGEVMVVLCPIAAWWAQRSSRNSTAGLLSGHHPILVSTWCKIAPGGSVTRQRRGHRPLRSGMLGVSHQKLITNSTHLTYLWAAIPALGYSLLAMLNPAMAGILSIWSTGLTLFLPWPIYALSLWLLGVILITSWRSSELTGWALLLLAAGGYAPQLSSQVFFSLIGLVLLSRGIIPAKRIDPTVHAAVLASQVAESRG